MPAHPPRLSVNVLAVIVAVALFASALTPTGVHASAPALLTTSGTADDPHLVPMTDGKVKVDGSLDETAWNEALVLELAYEVQPGENVPAPVRTEVLLTYDIAHLYIAFRCYDPDPSAIRAHLSDRDQVGGDDWAGVVLDTFNDERRSFDFVANPLGVQWDFIETASGSPSWDAIWESSGRITSWGYAIEMEIPFNQLRFQHSDEPQTWGFDAFRSYPRDQRHHLGVFPRDRNNNCYLCQAVKIKGFAGASPGRNIEASPTLTGVSTETRDEFPAGDLSVDNQESDPGITVKWGMTPNLTLSSAVNPDFSQVEADALQLDINTPFALYFSERRPFFLEGADFFDTLKDAVYTRTMHDPQWGLKLTGKEGRNTVGAYVVRDDKTNLIFPGNQGSNATSLPMESTASIMRYKRDIGSRYTIGGLLTSRRGDDYSNDLLGFDANLLVTQTDQFQIQLMRSSSEYPDSVAQDFEQEGGDINDEYVAFEWDHAGRSHYLWLDYDRVGKNFRADLGFIPRVGFENVEGGYFYIWNPPQGSWWSYLRVGGDYSHYTKEDGGVLNSGGQLWTEFGGRLQSWFWAASSQRREAYNGREYDLRVYGADAGFRPTGDLELGVGTLFGDRIDYANSRPADRIYLRSIAEYRAGKHVRLNFNHVYERLSVDLGRLYTANVSNLTAIYQFNVRTFFRTVLQYAQYDRDATLYIDEVDSEFSRFFTQLLFSYKINPQTMLFLGYSDNYFGNQEYDLTQSDRTFFAKLGYAFVL